MYIKQDLSNEKDVNLDLDNFCQNEANNLEYKYENDTCGDGRFAFTGLRK